MTPEEIQDRLNEIEFEMSEAHGDDDGTYEELKAEQHNLLVELHGC